MRNDDKDRPNRIHWPPIVYLAVLVLAYGLEWLLTLPALPGGLGVRLLGGLLVGAGIAIGAAGILRFRALATPVDPTARARVLASDGIYARTRNPMYLGALLAYAGLALVLGSTWLLLLVPAMAIALVKLAIEREEAFLERRFGEEYRAYKARVRRWL
jgi:protein-S-isoprenylcysteine O-methyltransferase Ste14